MRPINWVFAVVLSVLLFPQFSRAQTAVCLSKAQTVDLVAMLEASEMDAKMLTSCELLVKDLQGAVAVRDKKIDQLVKDLIKAKQDSLDYEVRADTWRKVAWYSVLAGGVAVAIQVFK